MTDVAVPSETTGGSENKNAVRSNRTHLLSDDNDNDNDNNENENAATMAGSRGFVQHVVGSLANASDVTMIEQSQARV